MRERIRVLVASHTYVVKANRRKLEALADLGIEVGLLVPEVWRDAMIGRKFRFEDGTGAFQAFPAPVPFAGRGGAYLFPPKAISKAVRALRPEIVHVEAECFQLVTAQMAALARHLRVPMTIFVCEDIRHPGWRAPLARWSLRAVRHLFAVNPRAERHCRSLGYEGPASILPQLGVELPPGGVKPRGFPTGDPRVVFVGRLARHKGVDVLIRALAELHREGIRARLVVVGAGPEEERLRALARDLGVGEALQWLGWVPHDEVPRVLADSDLLVLPSRRVPGSQEQFGHVLIEAMAAGLPVVGSSCGAIPEVIGCSEYIFPEGDAEALAQILRRLLTDPQAYEEAARHSVERVQAFSNENVARAMSRVWDDILTSGACNPSVSWW
jgi:glycosyltransferase involved in cell wall biosynthesis